MEKWIQENLSKIFDFPVPDDMTKFLMQKNEKDVEKYLNSLLDLNNSSHRQFIANLKKRKAGKDQTTGYMKDNDNISIPKKQNEKKKGKMRQKENTQQPEIPKTLKVEKKKTKFVNLYSEEGHDRATVLLKGKHKCDCEARKHQLINNCSNCGRIVCAQEGPGPCFFCNELICSPEQQDILKSNSKQADNLYRKLMGQKPVKGLEDSIKHRDRLLDNDRNSTLCTKVIDDEADYYKTSNIWLTSKEREKLQKHEEEMDAKKHASRLNKKMTFDFTGRVITEENDTIEEFTEEQFQKLCESISYDDLESRNVCSSIEFDRPMYLETDEPKPRAFKTKIPSNVRSRIQDKEYVELTDEGLCLSMHQPYASLLVAGIKIHEGRTWYTSHRGRLWIASASKVPTVTEITELQQFYRVLKNDKIVFPEAYPVSCLVGCVTVTDVLPQEEYRKIYPDGESDSPYVFICENFYTLPIKFPIQGKHKIYKLDEKIHQVALKCLEKLMKTRDN